MEAVPKIPADSFDQQRTTGGWRAGRDAGPASAGATGAYTNAPMQLPVPARQQSPFDASDAAHVRDAHHAPVVNVDTLLGQSETKGIERDTIGRPIFKARERSLWCVRGASHERQPGTRSLEPVITEAWDGTRGSPDARRASPCLFPCPAAGARCRTPRAPRAPVTRSADVQVRRLGRPRLLLRAHPRPAYLREHGRPIVGVWGLGLADSPVSPHVARAALPALCSIPTSHADRELYRPKEVVHWSGALSSSGAAGAGSSSAAHAPVPANMPAEPEEETEVDRRTREGRAQFEAWAEKQRREEAEREDMPPPAYTLEDEGPGIEAGEVQAQSVQVVQQNVAPQVQQQQRRRRRRRPFSDAHSHPEPLRCTSRPRRSGRSSCPLFMSKSS
ncbi:hypothetical protein B0H11DRAFT_2264310 [Mycena galericulata]|nr:hypothetical protein B0H11DRAFT_2264310 [Mycena galericulata]